MARQRKVFIERLQGLSGFDSRRSVCGAAGRGTAWPGNARQGKVFHSQERSMLFQKSADTKILESVLGELEIGQMATYGALSASIGRDVRKFAIGALNTARRTLFREKQMVFDVEVGKGVKRLDDSQIVDSVEADRQRIRRRARRTIDKLACVEFEKLSEGQKRKHVVASAQFGALQMFSDTNAAKKIAAKANGAKVIPIGDTLKLFGG
jgi:hypothetical protein